MDIKSVLSKKVNQIKNYRIVILVAVIGIMLLMIPTGSKKNTVTSVPSSQSQSYNVQDELAAILSKMDGVGNVQILLTIESEGETIYQNDSDSSRSDTGWDEGLNTVILTDASRNQEGLVRMKIAPVYRGAVVVCDGGDVPSVQLAVTQAVIRATGLKADQVFVMKMK